MRIALDRKLLLGFENGNTELDVPVSAAKVGTKTFVVGVSSASHSELTKNAAAPVATTLTFPARNA